MLSMSDVLQYIEYRLGYSHAEIKELTEYDMIKTVENVTLPVFSKYYPYFHNHVIDTEKDAVPNSPGTYYLKTDLRIFGVSKVLPWSMDITGRTSSRTFQDPVDLFIVNSFDALLVSPITYQFHPGTNTIELSPKNYAFGRLLVQLKAVHPPHCKFIPDAYVDIFKDLSLWDVCIGINAIRSKFTNISTIYGTLELDSSLLESAKDERKELIEKIKENYYKDARRKKIYVY